MMLMMYNDLMCTQKLTRSHSAKVKTDMPEKNEKQLESVESVDGKVELWRKECMPLDFRYVTEKILEVTEHPNFQ